MSFEYGEWVFLYIFIIIIIIYIVKKIRSSYYSVIERFWFFLPSNKSTIRFLLFSVSFLFMSVAILDLRGPEERIKASIPDQKTIIIIDASASMQAEDIRPNRFKRSLFLARHFIKQAAGHQIAVVLFSDTQKRLVPFTDDIDLLDARVAGLEDTNLQYGSSNINQAVKESLQYFKNNNDNEKVIGNILLFTDSEEHGAAYTLEDGVEVNLAVVGVGTLNGAPIPNRSRSGVFLNYKKHKGVKVISKLNENSIKNIGKDFKNFKYWISTSYTIPTEKILSFFRGIYKKKLGQTDIRVRPVYGHILVIIGVVIYFLASLAGLGKSYKKPMLVLMFLLLNSSENYLYANETNEARELEFIKKTSILKNGRASLDERKSVAQDVLSMGKSKEAALLYEEINSENTMKPGEIVNMGTALAMSGSLKKALDVYEKISNNLSHGPQRDRLLDIIRSNTLLAIKKKKSEKKKKGNKNSKNKDEKDKKDKKNGDKGKSGKSKKDKKKNEDKKNKKNKKKKTRKQDNESKKDKKEKKGKRKKAEENKIKDQPSTVEEKEKKIKQKRKMVKIPAMLKQIMDLDRDLQKKYYKTNTRQKRNNGQTRDW